jgi:hypothetical protein
MTSQAPTPLDGRQAAISEAARRLYDAEVALHIARQTGVSAWISAAYDRLHETIVAHNAALTLWPPASSGAVGPCPASPESRTVHAADPVAA